MKLSKIITTAALAIAISSASFASTGADINPTATNKAVTTQIRTMIQKLDIDASGFDSKTIKVKFMVTEGDELIVLSTGNSTLDKTIKNALNYKEVDNTSIKYNKVYILPVTFK